MVERKGSARAREVLASLRRASSAKARKDMTRYGIPIDHALGVPMRVMQEIAKDVGTDHSLALELWTTGIYEARNVAVFVDDPDRVTSRQMDDWAASFDSWAICDTACFKLFDRTAHAWEKVHAWSSSSGEFVRRASFALLWALALHDKEAADAKFTRALRMIEKAEPDDRPLVMKSVDMALRAIGKRSSALRKAAAYAARRLAESDDRSRQWIGKKALRGL